MKQKIILILGFLALLLGCVEKYEPALDTTYQYLVIQGAVTNENKDYIVSITKSKDVRYPGTIWEGLEDALVTINDNHGNVYVMEDHGGGSYVSPAGQFVGQVGREYMLRIETIEGEVYESIPQMMIPVPEIKNLEFEYEEKISQVEGDPLKGFQIYLDSEDPANECIYYRFVFEEIWEILIRWTNPPMNKRNCWVTQSTKDILVKNTSVLSENKIVKYPLKYISTDTDRLRIKYSLNVKQLSLNLHEYNYWVHLRNLAKEIGSLYDPLPSSVSGNVINCNNPNQRILGYFSVNAVSFKRVFISHSDHDLETYDMYKYCPEDRPPDGPFYILEPGKYTTMRKCVDCTTRGTNIKPDWWEDDN